MIVQGTGPDGAQIEVLRYAADVSSLGIFDTGGISNTGFEVDLSGWTTTLGSTVRVTGPMPSATSSP